MKRGLLLGVLILLAGLVSAAGVATSYWDENPLKLAEGESSIVTLALQNGVGDKDIILRAEITKNSEIATLIDNNLDYSVPLGSGEVPVEIRVEIPENAEIGETYEVKVSFKQTSSEEGGMVQITGAFTSKFPVEVVGYEESIKRSEPSKNINFIYVLLIALTLVIIIYLVKVRKGSKKK